jgi:hypothetical protein
VVSNLLRIKTVVKEHMIVSDEKRTNHFLGAASRGNTQRVKAMLQQQFNPDAADYDCEWASQFCGAPRIPLGNVWLAQALAIGSTLSSRAISGWPFAQYAQPPV